jgi:hypothetical protein
LPGGGAPQVEADVGAVADSVGGHEVIGSHRFVSSFE